MQVSNSPANKTKALSTIKNVYTQLGVRGLFRGYCVVLPMDIISGALYFGGNNICKQMVAHEQGKKSITDLSAPSLMCCGIVSGISSWLVSFSASCGFFKGEANQLSFASLCSRSFIHLTSFVTSTLL